MASADRAKTYDGVNMARNRRSRLSSERVFPPLILGPSLIALFIFVYGFIGATIWVSLSNWGSAKINWSIRHPLGITYQKLFEQTRFQSGLRNTFFFTVMFLLTSVGGGLILAILLDRKVFGNSIFRNIFLFPYALSFITTGVSWRWIFNPETGINLLFEQSGLNRVLSWIGLGPFAPAWLTDARVVGQINDGLGRIWPWSATHITTQLGLPLALIPVTIAAAWQLSGFAMAMYLAGHGHDSRPMSGKRHRTRRRHGPMATLPPHYHPHAAPDHDQRHDHPRPRLAEDFRPDLRDVGKRTGVRDRCARHLRLR